MQTQASTCTLSLRPKPQSLSSPLRRSHVSYMPSCILLWMGSVATVGRTRQVPSKPLVGPLLHSWGFCAWTSSEQPARPRWQGEGQHSPTSPRIPACSRGLLFPCSLMIKILYADHKDCCLCLSFFLKTNRCIWDPPDLLGVIYMATASSWGSRANIPMA